MPRRCGISITLPTGAADDEPPEVELSGRIRVGGRPAAGMKWTVRSLVPTEHGWLSISDFAWVEIDAEGRWRLSVPPAPRLRASLWDPATQRSWNAIEWERTGDATSEVRDFDLD